MLYRIKAGDREYQLVSWSIEKVRKAAREKVWQVAPGEEVLVFCGEELVERLTRISLFHDL